MFVRHASHVINSNIQSEYFNRLLGTFATDIAHQADVYLNPPKIDFWKSYNYFFP